MVLQVLAYAILRLSKIPNSSTAIRDCSQFGCLVAVKLRLQAVMDNDEDLDLHFCLGCQTTVMGLTNYVQHKKLECPARKNRTSQPTSSTSVPSSLAINVDDILSCLSPSTTSAIQPSMSPNISLYLPPGGVSPALDQGSELSLSSPCGSEHILARSSIDSRQVVTTTPSSQVPVSEQQSSSGTAQHTLEVITQANSNCSAGQKEMFPSTNDFRNRQETSRIDNEGFFGVLELKSKDHQGVWGSENKLEPSTKNTATDENAVESHYAQGLSVLHTESKSLLSKRTRHRKGDGQSKNVHAKTKAEHLTCEICSKTFTSSQRLEKHRATSFHRRRAKLVKSQENDTGSFFSVLQLQSKESVRTSQKTIHSNESADSAEPIRNSKITDILNRIQEESDSDEDELAEDPYGGSRPSKGHTGGKWTPGHCPPPGHTGGKWKPGTSEKTCDNGDDVSSVSSDSDEIFVPDFNSKGSKDVAGASEEVGVAEMPGTLVGMSKQPGPPEDGSTEDSDRLFCKTCNKVLTTKLGFKKHFESLYHFKRLPGPSTNLTDNNEGTADGFISKDVDSGFHCVPCRKVFDREWALVTHIQTKAHGKHAMGHPEHDFLLKKYASKIQLSSTFQCRICEFYSRGYENLESHIKSESHAQKVMNLVGPAYCVLCSYRTNDNKTLVEHFQSDAHVKTVKARPSKKKCIIKECRYEILCRLCGLFMHSKVHLQRHMSAKHSGKPRKRKSSGRFFPKCPHCNLVCASMFNLTIHVRRKHSKERPYNCISCKVTFCDKGTLRLHCRSQRHLEMVRGCNDTKTGQNHSSSSTRDPGKLVKCDFCDFSAESYPSLRPHYIEAHAKGGKKGKKKAGKFQCSDCEKTFADKHKLHIHGLTHSVKGLYESELKKASLTGVKYRDFLMGMTSHSTAQCPECGRTLRSKAQMLLHLRQHTGETPFTCPHCQKQYASSQALRKHIYRHLPQTDRACDVCSKVFTSSANLNDHMKLSHGTEHSTSVCDVCGKSFKSPKQLASHVYRLHREKTLECPFPNCRKRFACHSMLNAHTKIHTGQKSFLCDQCGYSSMTRNKLTRHKRSHTGERPFSCDYCPYKARDYNHLRRHLRIHIGSKPYKCPYCDYSCNVQENIRKHILKTRKHAGLFVYVCRFCMFGTNDAKEFKAHIVGLHSDVVVDPEKFCTGIFSGLYLASQDPRNPEEGQHIHQLKERKPKTPKDSITEPAVLVTDPLDLSVI